MAVARAYHPRSRRLFPGEFFRAVAPLRKPPAANRGRAKSTETTLIGGAAASWRRPSRNLAPGKTELAFIPSLFLDFPASLERASRSRFLSVYTAAASTTPSSSPSSSSACSRPAPPRTALFLSCFYLSFPSPTRRRRRRRCRRRARSSPSFSTFTLPALLFSPGRFPSSSSVSVSSEPPTRPDHPHVRIIRDGLLFVSPSPWRLHLATCYPDCLRYEARHTATWKVPRARGKAVRSRGRRGGREGR